jgi:hypothetical protein
MAKSLKAGDKVSWETSQGKTTGKVVKTATKTTKIEGFTAKASKDDPKVIVKSEKSGKRAAHKPESLEKA